MKKKLAVVVHEAFGGKWRIPLAIAAAIAMVLIAELAYQSQRKRLEVMSDMDRSRLLLKSAFQRVTDAESGKRGYLLVGGRDYLEPYLRAAGDVRVALDKIHTLDARMNDPELVSRQQRVDKLMMDKLAEMQEVLRREDSGRHADALDMVRSGIGREIMEKLRQEVEACLIYRSRLTTSGLRDVQDLLLLGRIGIEAMTVLSLIILIMFVRQGQARAIDREVQRLALLHERDRLEKEVEERMSDLKDLARHLQTAREDERARLARDLHDELGALLTTAKLDVAVMRPQLQKHQPELLPKLTHLTEALNSGIALKRRIIEDLCPSSLKTLGLVAALEILLSDTARVSGLKVVHSLEPVDLSFDEQLTVYRVVQESLTNAIKYAQAKQLTVRVRALDGVAVIEVDDDGLGFDARSVGFTAQVGTVEGSKVFAGDDFTAKLAADAHLADGLGVVAVELHAGALQHCVTKRRLVTTGCAAGCHNAAHGPHPDRDRQPLFSACPPSG